MIERHMSQNNTKCALFCIKISPIEYLSRHAGFEWGKTIAGKLPFNARYLFLGYHFIVPCYWGTRGESPTTIGLIKVDFGAAVWSVRHKFDSFNMIERHMSQNNTKCALFCIKISPIEYLSRHAGFEWGKTIAGKLPVNWNTNVL